MAKKRAFKYRYTHGDIFNLGLNTPRLIVAYTLLLVSV